MKKTCGIEVPGSLIDSDSWATSLRQERRMTGGSHREEEKNAVVKRVRWDINESTSGANFGAIMT